MVVFGPVAEKHELISKAVSSSALAEWHKWDLGTAHKTRCTALAYFVDCTHEHMEQGRKVAVCATSGLASVSLALYVLLRLTRTNVSAGEAVTTGNTRPHALCASMMKLIWPVLHAHLTTTKGSASTLGQAEAVLADSAFTDAFFQ